MDTGTAEAARARGGVILRDDVRTELAQRRVASGELRRAGRRILLAATTPDSWDQRLFVTRAELGEPAHFTGAAGLQVYGTPHRPPEPEVITALVPSWRNPLDVPGVRIVRAGPADLVGARVIHGHPVASLEVVLRYSAREVSNHKLVTLLQDELRLRHTTEHRLLSVTGRGREGSQQLRRALAVAGDGAHSRQERRLHRGMRHGGITGYRRSANLVTPDGFSYWLDFLWMALLAGLEVNGAHHLDPAQAEYDARRARRVLTHFGVVLLPLTTGEIDADLDGAVREVESFLISRARRLGVPAPIV